MGCSNSLIFILPFVPGDLTVANTSSLVVLTGGANAVFSALPLLLV